MGRRPAVLAAAAFLPGVLIGYYIKNRAEGMFLLPCLFIITAVFVMILAFLIIKKKRICCINAVFIVIFLLGMIRSVQSANELEQLQTFLRPESEQYLAGQIYKKEVKNLRNILYLKQIVFQDQSAPVTSYRVQAYLDTESYSIGQILYLKGRVLPFSQAVNEGGFDETTFYHGQKIGFRFQPEKVLSVAGSKNIPAEAMYQFRRRMLKVYTDYLGASKGGLLASMLLGDKEQLDSDSRNLFQKAGISHILAISGLHISILGMAFFHILRRRQSYLLSAVLSGGLIFYYVGMTGASVSSVRAGLMFFVFLYSQHRGRSYDLLSAMSAAGLMLVWNNPGVLFQAGFLLSMSAVAGVGVTLILQKKLQAVSDDHCRLQKILNNLGATLVLSLGIQAATIPLIAWFFFEIPVYSILWNLFVLPSMGILVFLGMLGGGLALIFPAAAAYLLLPVQLQLILLESGSNLVSRLPNAVWITGRPSWIWMAGWYLLASVGYLYLIYGKRKKWYLNMMFASGFLVLLLSPRTLNPEISILDVGQGDGIYIRTDSKENLFIDGGSSSNKQLGRYTILPFLKSKGIREVDYWFLSHADMDHVNGFIQSVESGYAVRNLVVSAYMLQDEMYDTLVSLAGRNKIRILKMKPGDRVSALKEENWSIRCLYPGKEDVSDDRNARSLTLLYRQNNYQALFTGDLATEEEERMVGRNTLEQVDLFKSSHHGSDYSNGELLLSVIQPKLTVISCGSKNNYGHPGKNAMDRIARIGGEILFTMKSGQIRVDKNGISEYLKNRP